MVETRLFLFEKAVLKWKHNLGRSHSKNVYGSIVNTFCFSLAAHKLQNTQVVAYLLEIIWTVSISCEMMLK